MIDFEMITACGEGCFGCTKKENGTCSGYIESDGKVPAIVWAIGEENFATLQEVLKC